MGSESKLGSSGHVWLSLKMPKMVDGDVGVEE